MIHQDQKVRLVLWYVCGSPGTRFTASRNFLSIKGAASTGQGDDLPEFDEIMARFQRLRVPTDEDDRPNK